MASGPFFPHSAYPATPGSVFPNFYVGGGANSKQDEGLGVKASLGANASWELRFQLPPAIPVGTAKLRILALANATSGAAKVTPYLAKVAAGASPSAAALTAESQITVTWAAGDNDKYKDATFTLTNTTIVAGDELKELVCRLTFNSTGWTLAQISTWIVSLIWE